MPRLLALRDITLPGEGTADNSVVPASAEFDCPEAFAERFLRIGAAEKVGARAPKSKEA